MENKMITAEMKEKMFERLWESDYIDDERYGKDAQLDFFNAALDLILPLLELSFEALREVRDFETCKYDDGTTARYPSYKEGWFGVSEFAGKAIQEIESELRRLSE
jgi:hypothetical protein